MYELIVLILLLCVNVLMLGALLAVWRTCNGHGNRLTRLEAQQGNQLTAAEVRAMFERLANIEGRLEASTRMMQTIQDHLLENDP